MSDFIPNKLGFDINAYMQEFYRYLDIALNRLSYSVQDVMKREIMTNGNGSRVMRETACAQVKELERKVDGTEATLVVGIDESKLGGFGNQVFVRTMVVLHGNVASGPLMTKPGKMTWKKDVNYMSPSPAENKDGTPRKPKIMPNGFMQFEMVNGFGAARHMLDNILGDQLNHIINDFYDLLGQLLNNIDYSQFITGG